MTNAPTKPDYTGQSHTGKLPFVNGKGKHFSGWNVKPTDDYGEACRKGGEYAAHFIQLMHDQPFYAGFNIMPAFIKDMDFDDESMTKGYYVGLFSYLEKALFLYSKHYDNWEIFLKWQAETDDILLAREQEAKS